MPPSNAMENDKKRLRNQFTKDERTRLLAIMTEYGPLLDDKNISILSRKEIWEIIENKFNENGHSGRTSAQLKKYWQNYKYHSKRTKIIHKEVPKPLSPMTKHMVRMLAKVNPEEWAQYDVAVNSFPTKKSPESSKSSPSTTSSLGKREGPLLMPKISTPPHERSLKSSAADASCSASKSRVRSAESSGIRNAGSKGEISESNVVVSTTDVPGSSVTVSVICPEVNSSKARTIFWKRSMLPEKTGPSLESNLCNGSEQVVDDFGSEVGISDVCSQEVDDMRSAGRPVRQKSNGMLPGNNSERSGPNPSNKRSARNHQLPAVDDRLAESKVVPRQRVSDNQSAAELIGNVIGVVKEMPKATVRLSKESDSMEISGPLSLTNGRSETSKIPAGGCILNPFSSGSIISQENRVRDNSNDSQKVDVDYSQLNEILKEFSAVKASSKRTGIPKDVEEIMQTFNKGGNGGDPIEVTNGKVEMQDMMRCMMNRGGDSSTQDFLWLKLWLRLLGGVRQSGRNRSLEILRKFEALISTMSFGDEKNEDDEESSDSDRTESEQGMEVDEDTSPENGTAKLRVRRVSLMEPAVGGNEIQREIKVETEMEPAAAADVAQNTLNDNTVDDHATNSMNYLVQAKLQFAKSELDHQLKLQKLETEEKELRVRIAEMTIQETRLRIQALIEERLRAKEIHELRLSQMAAEKVRSEAEHAARIDTSCIATAEGRARISCIERDHERSENLYQMQLRCISASSANGNCGVKCKQYQQ